MHSSPDDCWVSFLGGVFDITALLAQNEGALSEPLIQAAGEDISHWFDATTGDVKRHVDPLTNLPAAYAPMGRFIHVPPNEPTNDWSTIIGKPWWQDQTYRVRASHFHMRRDRRWHWHAVPEGGESQGERDPYLSWLCAGPIGRTRLRCVCFTFSFYVLIVISIFILHSWGGIHATRCFFMPA
jgi:hypothetical protein